MSKLFKLRGELDTKTGILLGILGIALVVGIWFLFTMGTSPILKPSILPSPSRVVGAFADLYFENSIIQNTCLSIGLTMSGYLEAILIAIPLGFLIGLFPIFRGGFQKQVDAMRYIPIVALGGLFTVWFGIGTAMKVHFLAFGIVIFLLPVVIQRIFEVKDVFLKTVYTLGASDWQTIKTVYWPSVISRLSDDIRVLTAISWTYIVFIELRGSQGGLGDLIYKAGFRQGRADKIFAIVIIIMIFGVIQDRIFVALDRHFFPYKFQAIGHSKSGLIKENSLIDAIRDYAVTSFTWLLLGVYLLLFVNEFIPFVSDKGLLSYLFGDTVIVIHLVMWTIIIYKLYGIFSKRKAKPLVEKITESETPEKI